MSTIESLAEARVLDINRSDFAELTRSELEAEIEADFNRMLREETLAWNLGYSAGFETTGMVTSLLYFQNSAESLSGADPAVAGPAKRRPGRLGRWPATPNPGAIVRAHAHARRPHRTGQPPTHAVLLFRRPRSALRLRRGHGVTKR